MTTVSVNLKTESGDDYLFQFKDIKNSQDFVNRVHKEMLDELAWVYNVSVVPDNTFGDELKQALIDKIENMEQE